MATSFRDKGMHPVNEFPDSRNSARPSSRSNSGGMFPVNELPLRFRWVRWVKWKNEPNDDGILPVSLLLGSSNLETRLGVPFRVTPSQLVMGVSRLQLRVAVALKRVLQGPATQRSRA